MDLDALRRDLDAWRLSGNLSRAELRQLARRVASGCNLSADEIDALPDSYENPLGLWMALLGYVD